MQILIYAVGPETSQGMLTFGGTRFWIEMSKRWGRENEISVVSSPGTYKICKEEDLDASFHVISSFDCDASKYVSYIIGIIKQIIIACRFKVHPNSGILFSPSHYLWDVLPTFLLKRKSGHLKWVVVIHNIVPSPVTRQGSLLNNLLSYIAQMVSFLVIRSADVILTVSSLVGNHLVRLGFEKNKIHIIWNGVPFKDISQIQASQKDAYDAIFLGRLHPTKGIFDLIEAWEYVTKEKNDALLAIIGPASSNVLAKYIKDRIIKLGLQRNVHMFGFLPSCEAYRIMKSSRVFVFPSYEENWGIAVYEAMACGLPVIAYNLPAYESLKNAIVTVKSGDIKTFAESILRLLSDEQLTAKMSRKTLSVASQFDWDKVSAENWALLTEVLNNSYEDLKNCKPARA